MENTTETPTASSDGESPSSAPAGADVGASATVDAPAPDSSSESRSSESGPSTPESTHEQTQESTQDSTQGGEPSSAQPSEQSSTQLVALRVLRSERVYDTDYLEEETIAVPPALAEALLAYRIQWASKILHVFALEDGETLPPESAARVTRALTPQTTPETGKVFVAPADRAIEASIESTAESTAESTSSTASSTAPAPAAEFTAEQIGSAPYEELVRLAKAKGIPSRGVKATVLREQLLATLPASEA